MGPQDGPEWRRVARSRVEPRYTLVMVHSSMRPWGFVLAVVLACGNASAREHPGPQDPDGRAQLLREAERALTLGPFSVMQKSRVAPSGNKHDFVSFAPYWWPDPAKPHGLPYIRRDGEVNPESRLGADDQAFSVMQAAVRLLATAYKETGEERFAARAALLLRTWFLDPATQMTPHLTYGQAVPGLNDGRGAGIIATRHMAWIIEASQTIAASPSWADADQKGLKAWCASYATWLQTSRNGMEEAGARNNHGTWYEAQLVAMLLYTGRPAEARARLESAAQKRLAAQIEPDGRQPLELARTRSWNYSVMNLEGWFALARLGREAGVDLWNARTRDGRSVRAALDYLVMFADNGPKWPHQQITPFDVGPLVPLLREAAVQWRSPAYAALADRLGAGHPPQARERSSTASARSK